METRAVRNLILYIYPHIYILYIYTYILCIYTYIIYIYIKINIYIKDLGASQMAPVAMQETQEMQVRSLGWEDPLEEEMATHSNILA